MYDHVQEQKVLRWKNPPYPTHIASEEKGRATDMTKPTKWVCAQQSLRSAWASALSDQSLRCPLEESLGPEISIERKWRHWSEWADAQADLSLHWEHTRFVGFVM